MPTAARRPCTWPGCAALVSDGSRCVDHKRKAEQQRGSAHERGYTSAWVKARAAYLARHPLCVHCERDGRVTASRVVDHKTPHRGDKTLFWDSDGNWQPLCKPCHDSHKQRAERSGREIGASLAGIPLDPTHPWNQTK